jgi:hypothetical protein
MKYDTWVTMEEIRPIGEIKYAAHAHIRGKGDVQHGLGESWGRTREEAESKMNVRIQEWLEANK